MTKKRSIAIVTIITIFLLLLQSSPAFAADINWPEPGAIHLNKFATPVADDEYSFRITLTVEGKNIVTPTNVVIVLDTSGSMLEDNRMVNARAAALELVEILQATSASGVSIAVVSFSNGVVFSGDFYGVDKKDELKAEISAIEAIYNTGTNLQAGIKEAKDKLDAETGNNVIVVLSDGQPTYSFKPLTATGYDKLSEVVGTTLHQFKITNFDYNTTIGLGSAYNFTAIPVDSYSVEDNGIGAISEAIFAKDAGIEIFSVSVGQAGSYGMDIPEAMGYVMTNISTDANHAVTAASEELVDTFKDIAAQIAYAAENGTVTDTMAAIPGYPNDIAFEPVLDGSLPMPTVSQGNLIPYNSATKQFVWDTGTIMEGTAATLTYYVSTSAKLLSLINDGSIDPSTTIFPTNESAVYDYTDVYGKQASDVFPVPEVMLPNTRGMVYAVFVRVNEKGEYLDASGTPLIPEEQSRPELAKELGRKQILNDVDNNLKGSGYFILGNNYNIKLPADHGVVGYKPVGSQTVSITPKDTQTYVYFGFLEVPEGTIVITFIADTGGSFKESNVNTIVCTYQYGEKVVAPTPLANKGYEFSKWDKAVPAYATEDMTITAKFKSLSPGGGTGVPKTGDESTYVIPIISLILSIVALPVIIAKQKKRNEI